MSVTMKLKKDGAYVVIDMPPAEKCTADMFRTWQGKPCVLEFADVNKTIYAYGDESVRGRWEDGKIVMGMDTFADFWMYKLLELGLDTFSKVSLREERVEIMTAEGESAAIAGVLASRPDLFQVEMDFTVPDDF